MLTTPQGKDKRWGGIYYNEAWVKQNCVSCGRILPRTVRLQDDGEKQYLAHYEAHGNFCSNTNDCKKRIYKAKSKNAV